MSERYELAEADDEVRHEADAVAHGAGMSPLDLKLSSAVSTYLRLVGGGHRFSLLLVPTP